MGRITTSLVTVMVVGLLLAGAGKETPTIAGLSWLAGTWKGPLGGGEFVAYYSTPEGGRVLSYSEMRAGGKVAFHEFERFQTGDGKILLTPFPGGQPAATFELVALEKSKATFENPKKDFPTRIVYHRVAKDRLVITLSDPHGGSDKVQTFDLKRDE